VPKDRFSKQKTEDFTIPIYSNGIGENALYGYTDIAKINEPCVTISARGTIGYSEYRRTPFYPVVRLICAIPNDEVRADYLNYVIQTLKFKVPTTGIPQLTVPMLANYIIPVPPLEVQQRIVNVLDNFDSICSDLKIGLPAEIEKRRQQYENYRDKLLTFDLRSATILDRQTDRQTDRQG